MLVLELSNPPARICRPESQNAIHAGNQTESDSFLTQPSVDSLEGDPQVAR